jgi:hypothetical protein
MSDRTKRDSDIWNKLRLLRLSDRVTRHLCLECGTSEQVVKGLCTECRKLPRYQAWFAIEIPPEEPDA